MLEIESRGKTGADLLRLVTLILSFLLMGKIVAGSSDIGYRAYCAMTLRESGEIDPLCMEDARSKGEMMIAIGSFLVALTYGFAAFVRTKDAGAKKQLVHLLLLGIVAGAIYLAQRTIVF